jgi:hypothetical protein
LTIQVHLAFRPWALLGLLGTLFGCLTSYYLFSTLKHHHYHHHLSTIPILHFPESFRWEIVITKLFVLEVLQKCWKFLELERVEVGVHCRREDLPWVDLLLLILSLVTQWSSVRFHSVVFLDIHFLVFHFSDFHFDFPCFQIQVNSLTFCSFRLTIK